MGIQRLLWVLSFVFPLGNSFAQEKCATVEVTENRRNRFLLRETDEQFEDWIGHRRSSRSGRINASGEYTIPVVFHIVHNGEAVGTGVNISDEQVISQIEVLNRDFTRTNADASSTPSEFQSVAGSLNIKFILATQDPNHEATRGIVRVKGSKSQWSMNDERTLKSQSYWPTEDYLNIWVTNISSSILGYAQFPASDLAGLESAEDNRLTDGVVIDYTVVGSNEDGSFNLTSNFNKGRTTTHEVGHFLGLRHIWGDDNGSCSGNGDYVADTPNQANSTSGCPSHPQTSCNVHTMFQNYMDYTNDICMNLFTVGQVERMVTVLENSPRRASLLNSHGAEPLSPVENDITILSISSPIGNVCEARQVPVLAVQNSGLNDITDVEIEVSVNGNEQRVGISLPQSLPPGQTASLPLDALTFSAGDNALSFQIISTNGFTDGKSANNFIETSVYFPHAASLPFTDGFASLSDQWKNVQGGTVNWTVATAPKESGSNTALYLNFFNAITTGEPGVLFSPTFALHEDGAPYLVFDIACAQLSSSKNDGLKVFVVSDCSDDYLSGKEVFYKSGPDLSTASVINSSFKPAGDSDWSHNAVDLSAFKGQRDLRLAFVGMNAGGNNIYIDNVRVVDNVTEDVSITEVLSPTPVQCETGTAGIFTVFNEGVSALNSVKVACYLNGEFVVLQSFSGLHVGPGESTKLSIPGINLIEGENHLSFILQEPNGLFDLDTADNDMSVYSVWNSETDIIPLRQNFADGLNAWTVVSPFGGNEWKFTETNYGQSLFFGAGSDNASNEGWLVSPSLDLSTTSVASVVFDVFYSATLSGVSMSSKEKEAETFKVLVSVDCGATYDDTVWSEMHNGSGSNIVNEPPDSESQWRRAFIDLSSYAEQGSIRLAFVAIGFIEGNFYLDNVEFFLSDDSTAVETELPYAVYGTDPGSPHDFYITFNLPERQAVNYSIIDLNGRQIIARQLEDVLNQTFQIEPNVSAGMYIFRLQIGTRFYATRVYLN